MIVCFEKQLAREWFRIAEAVKQLGLGMHGKGLAQQGVVIPKRE